MRISHRWATALVAFSLLFTLSGCLSLGGKTVYSSESPQTNDRLTALETRVSLLEQAVTGKSTPAPVPVPSEHPH